ncbi:MAG: GrpB family protein, partial [Victivallaceae bacterium]
ALEPIGFSYEGNPTIKSGEMLFYKGYTPDGFAAEVFHLHLRNPGDWDELYFRDYLRLHPEIADEYAVLKAELAVKYKFDRDAYTLAKGDFIRRQTAAARIEFPGRYQP